MRALLCILIALTAFWLCACGKRATETKVESLEAESFARSNYLEYQHNISSLEVSSIKPYDNSKPMIVNGVSYYNSSITFDKSILHSDTERQGESLSYDSSKAEKLERSTERTDYSNIWIGLSLSIGTLIVMYLTIKRYIP